MKFDRAPGALRSVSEYGDSQVDYKTFLKQTLLLATAIFLITAPAPDSHDIAEMTGNFVAATGQSHPSTLKAD
jgi:hypothetical protein